MTPQLFLAVMVVSHSAQHRTHGCTEPRAIAHLSVLPCLYWALGQQGCHRRQPQAKQLRCALRRQHVNYRQIDVTSASNSIRYASKLTRHKLGLLYIPHDQHVKARDRYRLSYAYLTLDMILDAAKDCRWQRRGVAWCKVQDM